jgi:hypothetical protein
LASAAKAFGFWAMAASAAGFCWARAMKPGLVASARNEASLTISSKTSVCISFGTLVSPRTTSLVVTWLTW